MFEPNTKGVHNRYSCSRTMIRSIIFLLLIGLGSIVQATPSGDDFLKMIGHRVDVPEMQELLDTLATKELKESYQPFSETYSIESFEYGIALKFNKNFILKEIRFYDSGYVYQKCPFKLPLYHKIRIHEDRFFDRFGNYDKDPSNPFLYNGRFENGKVKVYFKDRHSELITLTYNEEALNRSDRESLAHWGFRVIPDGKCLNTPFGGTPCYEGMSEMVWPDRNLKLKAMFKYGVPHGKGGFEDTTGLEYQGSFKLGFLWGIGQLEVPGQYRYTGELLMGKRNGSGSATYSNGTRYAGHWLNDKMDGHGTFWYSENYVYTGQFSQDEIKGKGKLSTPEGTITGSFRKGRPHGFAEQYVNSSQTTLSGTYVDGKKQGEFTLKSPFYGVKKLYFENDVEVADPNAGN